MTEAVHVRDAGALDVPTYARLGVQTFINCKGTYTMLGGSLPLNEVIRAMEQASRSYVNIEELHDAAGMWLAERTGAEWGLVTSGASAALCQLTAACLTGGDPERMLQLPEGPPGAVITQASHRTQYEFAVRMTGATVTEVASRRELEEGLRDSAAMVLFLGEARDAGKIGLAETVAAARRGDVPVVVDAAAERPDKPDFYLSHGVDAVIYSGGKCLRGPQNTGLVLGRKTLLEAALKNAAPHDALGRPMKVSKEALMGLLAAVEVWYHRDHEKEWAAWQGMLDYLAGELSKLPSVYSEVRNPPLPSNVAPVLLVWWDQASIQMTNVQLQARLRAGQPRIEVPLDGAGISIMPYMMEPGEERTVAAELTRHFREAPAYRRGPGGSEERVEQELSCSISGSWKLRVGFAGVTAEYKMTVHETGGVVTGTLESAFASTELSGRCGDGNAELQATMRVGANSVTYCFNGAFGAHEAEGTVDAGQYGSTSWAATRIS